MKMMLGPAQIDGMPFPSRTLRETCFSALKRNVLFINKEFLQVFNTHSSLRKNMKRIVCLLINILLNFIISFQGRISVENSLKSRGNR